MAVEPFSVFEREWFARSLSRSLEVQVAEAPNLDISIYYPT